MESKRIKNKLYVEFLEKGLIQTLELDDLDKLLNRITGPNTKQARSLVIALYFTGARPCEVLKLRAKDFKKERNYVVVQVMGAKNGLPRPIRIPYKFAQAKELWEYVSSLFPDLYVFYHFQSKTKRFHTTKSGKIVEYNEISNKLKYWFKKWSDDTIIPYFLRHNRFSKLSQKGATAEELRILKGAKTYTSITPYIHMSKEFSQKIARKID